MNGISRDGAYGRHILVGAVAVGLAAGGLTASLIVVIALGFAVALAASRSSAAIVIAAMAAVIFGSAIGGLRLAAIDASPLAGADGQVVELRGHLIQRPRVRAHGASMRVRAGAGGTRSQAIEVRATGELPRMSIGDELTVRGKLTTVSVRGQVGASRDYAAYLLREGVRLSLAGTVLTTGARRGGVAGAIDAIRRRSDSTLATGLPREPAALLRGMVLGGDAGLPPATVEAFRVVGLSHILAVSGANVLLLVILVQAISRVVGLGRLARLLIPVALICIYVPLCGAQASVIRAGVMGLAGLAAVLASRPSTRVYALLLAAAVLLAWNPRAIADVGAQLSFAAVVGMMIFCGPLQRRLGRWPRWLAEAFAATVGATVATAPLMAFHFGTFSVISLAANLVAAPLIGPIVWLGSLAAAVGQLSLPLGALLNAPNAFLLATLASVAKSMATLPHAQVAVPGFGLLPLLAGCLLIVGAACLVHRDWILGLLDRRWTSLWMAQELRCRITAQSGSGRTAASQHLGRDTAFVVIGLALVGSVAWALVGVPSARRVVITRPAIVFLDVGQGDAVLVLGSSNCEVLIDGGSPGFELRQRLRSLGIDRLELVVATHAQLDHYGGLAEIAEAGEPSVESFLDGGGPTRERSFLDLRRRFERRRVHAVPAQAGARWRCGDLRLDTIGPEQLPPGAAVPADPNLRAAATVIDAGRMRMLTTGDAESPQLLRLGLPRVDVLKVAHHGSADPLLPALLQRTAPRLAAISVGAGNRYGHPVAETLRVLRAATRVYRTDVDGEIVVNLDASGALRVASAK